MALARERIGGAIMGVLTTGIYCLPTCRAKKPKPENVRYFQTTQEARAAGLRPCKICNPDEFERGIDPDLDRLEALASSVRARPSSYGCVEAIAEDACVSPSTLHQQFRQHFQLAPGTFLARSRIEAAQKLLLDSDLDTAQVGFEVGFESTSGFYDGFRKLTGMAPAAYRALKNLNLPRKTQQTRNLEHLHEKARGKTLVLQRDQSHSSKPKTQNLAAGDFRLSLPEGYPVPELLRVLSRDPESSSERLSGQTYAVAYSHEGTSNLLTMEFGVGEVRCALEGEDAVQAQKIASRILNLKQDPGGFERQVTEMGFAALYEQTPKPNAFRITSDTEDSAPVTRKGLRISQTPTIFEGLVWVTVGQQVNFRFAAALRRRVHELVGRRIGDLYCVPEASQVAAIDPTDLLKLQFSRQKADYLINAARMVASGELDLDALESASATTAEKRLLAVRGIGIWSANYLMMRSLGFQDCVPAGDTGISSGLMRFLGLDRRPKAEEVVELMKQFSPYRSLACYHLWRGNAA